MLTFFFFLAGFLFYGIMGSVVGAVLHHRWKNTRSYDGVGPVMAGIFWPLGIWSFLVLFLNDRLEARTERKRLAAEEQRKRDWEYQRLMEAAKKELESL